MMGIRETVPLVPVRIGMFGPRIPHQTFTLAHYYFLMTPLQSRTVAGM